MGKKPQKRHVTSAFTEVIVLGLFIMALWLFMFVTEDALSSVKLISIIMTLGGLETYDQTVIGFGIIVFLFGITAIAFSKSAPNHNPTKKQGRGHKFQ